MSSGTIGTNSYLALGTVPGFYDPGGFDQLQVKCRIENNSPADYQTLALDNLSVMFTNLPPAPAIYGSDFSVNPTSGIASLTVWDTIPGCQYRVVYTESLASPIWSPVTPPLPGGWKAGGGTLTFTDPGAAGPPHRFYRVEARSVCRSHCRYWKLGRNVPRITVHHMPLPGSEPSFHPYLVVTL